MAETVPAKSPFRVILPAPPAAGKDTIARRVCRHFPKTLAEINLDKIKGFVESDPRTDVFLDLASDLAQSMARIYLNACLSVFIHNAFCKYDFVRPFISLADELRVPVWYFKLTAPVDEL